MADSHRAASSCDVAVVAMKNFRLSFSCHILDGHILLVREAVILHTCILDTFI